MKHNTFFNKFLRLEPYYHIVFWCLVLFYPYIKFAETGYKMSFLHELNALFFKMSISYFLYFYVFPRKQKKWALLTGLLGLVINTFLYQYFHSFFHDENYYGSLKEFISNYFTFLSFSMFFLGLFIFKTSLKKQLKIDTLINENQKAKLNNLKAQVNPHFLFNTLNTIYGRAVKTDEKTASLILKLSNGFRYFLHEGQQERVSVQQEILHLKDYIDLQKERLSKKVTVDFNTKIDDFNERITPLLFIPFIENAFKYSSILKGENHKISIALYLENKILEFHCSNPYNEKSIEKNDWIESGIGITNTKKRLELLYPKKHKLIIDDEGSVFKIHLNIQL